MNDRASAWLTATICGLIMFAGLSHIADAKEPPMKSVKVVMLKEWDMPDPNKVCGILIYNAPPDLVKWDTISDRDPNWLELSMLIGNRNELEEMMGRHLNPIDVVPAGDWLINTLSMYPAALAMRNNSLLASLQSIIFITPDAAYVRGFGTKYGEVLDAYMSSGAIWREFRKIGGLNWTEPDANVPSFVPPISGLKEHGTPGLAARGLKITALGGYDFPTEDVRGILIYGESNLNAEHGLEDRNLCLAVGNPSELVKLLGTRPRPRLMVADPNAVSRICHLYRETLGQWSQEADRLGITPQRRMYGTAWTIVFISDRAIYIRGFGARPRQQVIYDEWMESPDPQLWQEFVRIGYYKQMDNSESTRGTSGPRPDFEGTK